MGSTREMGRHHTSSLGFWPDRPKVKERAMAYNTEFHEAKKLPTTAK
jgi:hypothetical protein